MVLVNYTTRELTAKVVYYGPGLCGKTTNLQYIFDSLPPDKKGKMISLATKTDRTLFFDFLPLDLGTIKGMRTRIQLYTVPGQVFYNETRKLVLRGADGIVFVADSNRNMMDANMESLQNLRDNLREYDINLDDLPLVLQYNKRDLPNIYSVEELDQTLKRSSSWPSFEAVAIDGTGVHESLKAISKLVLRHLAAKFSAGAAAEKPLAAATPVPAPTPPPVAATPPPAPSPPPVKEKPASIPVLEVPEPEPAPVEKPVELEPPPAAKTGASIGGDLDDEEYASFYGTGGVGASETTREAAVPVETGSSGSATIGGDLDEDDYAAFYGGGGDPGGDEGDFQEEDSISIEPDSDTEDTAAYFQSEDESLEEEPAAPSGPHVEIGDLNLKDWMGEAGSEPEEDVITLEEDDEVLVLDASDGETAGAEPEISIGDEIEMPAEPERAPAPVAPPRGGPEIHAEQAVEVPIPLELIGGHAEITRTVVIPLKFTSPGGEQIMELKLHLQLRPKSG